ncbi:MAG: sensor histidine kinase [Candidatus Electrothrix sp. YB6]
MKSLFTKILFWFFLNLLLLAAVLAVFFALQPQVNLHELFGQQGSDRLRVAGMLIAHDLEQMPEELWPDILARHAGIHGVEFLLILQNGSVFSLTKEKVPGPVMHRAKELLQRRGRLKPEHGFMRGKQGRPQQNLQEPPPCEPECPLPDSLTDRRQRSHHERFGRKPHLIMRTANPTRYWFGMRIPVIRSPIEREPGMLLAVSDSMTGNGFFFDPLPWMVVAGAVVLISVLLWIPLIRSITRPLVRLTRAAEEIARGNFEVAIHEPRADEIGQLARTISHMTARLSAFVSGQKRFLGDVSHELGSPVARIQFGLGILEQRLTGEDQDRVMDVLEDVEHMSSLIGELLAFSRAEMNAEAVQLHRIDLLPVVQTAVKREGSESAEIKVQVEPDIRVLASAELLTRAMANLLRNAVKYAGKAGPISVAAEERNGQVEISVKDCGPGVAEEYLDRLFDPFFRPEPSRDRSSGGVGLGLAIVKTCVETCRGTVSARNRQEGGFAVSFFLEC